ncbi:obscurin-like protein 1 isoform X3 [Ornithorhynchus anatinus]|uniref:obscurin-like protein 1 isoform X3 n=1 Tax=Ornithorhynchus anatinus TaxID=9258 RepID=UPI0010A83F05|nr:obscurin-like protein 1 isoform X3 [Ornithorhynchus anatinus]
MRMEGLRGAPRFLSFPKPVQVEDGADAILQCRLAGSPPPTVTWEKDGRPLEASERLWPRAAGAQCGLLVRGARPGDAGLYVCRARNPTGEAFAAASLSVRDPGTEGPAPSRDPSLTAPNPSQNPSLTAPGPSQTPSPEASAPSQVASFPTSGLPQDPSLVAPGPSLDPLLPAPCLPQDPSLMTPNPRRGPSDTSGPPDRVEALPHPLPLPQKPSAQPPALPPPPGPSPPTFLRAPRSQSVMRGAEVVLSCQVRGPPGVRLHWEKDGQPLGHVWESSHFTLTQQPDGSHALRIRAARIPDAGVYVCRARDPRGEAVAAALLLVEPPEEEASPLPPPRRRRKPGGAQTGGRQEPKNFWVSEGKHAKFRCYVTGKPAPETVWHRDGRALAPGRRHLLYRARDGGFVLKVLYCQPDDRGLYVCSAHSDAGTTLSAVQLNIKEPRVRFAVPLEDVEGDEHGSAVLECQVPAPGEPTAWYREERRLQPGAKYELGEAGAVRRLVIHDLQPDDDGIYLCEMRGRVRTVAAVTVKGTILQRLPRKLEALEGEHVVFSVKTREAEAGGLWSRDGQELPASPRVLQTRFGRTHSLVLVGVTVRDAGTVTFSLGASHTSAQLRVTRVQRAPPGSPLSAELNAGSGNAALLSWRPPVPTPDPPCTYLLEWQEVGTEAWVPCLKTEAAGAVEVAGDGVPREGHYSFRLWAVSELGRSPPVVFPGSVHLAPTVRVHGGLEDVRVPAGHDAVFSLKLSASVSGAWFLDGVKVEADGEGPHRGADVRAGGPDPSLTLRAVRPRDDGTRVEFVRPGMRHSATLRVQEPPVRVVRPLDEVTVEAQSSERVELTCELSRPGVPVRWYRDGVEVEESETLQLESRGPRHRLLLPAVRPQDAGTFVCDTGDDSAAFSVVVSEPPVRVVQPLDEVTVEAQSSERVVLTCELSRPGVPVRWYRDGLEVEESENLQLESRGPLHRLLLPAVRPQDAGEFVCDAGDDSAFFSVVVSEPPVRVVQPREEGTVEAQSSERSVGLEVEDRETLQLENRGPRHPPLLPTAQPQDAGDLVRDAADDSVAFSAIVSEAPGTVAGGPRDPQGTEGDPATFDDDSSRARAELTWHEVRDRSPPGTAGKDSSAVANDEARGARVTVRDGSPAPALWGLKPVWAREGDTATFHCSVAEDRSRSGSGSGNGSGSGEPRANACWRRRGLVLRPGPTVRLRQEGNRHFLILSELCTEDAGEISFQAGNARAVTQLEVEALPVLLVRRPPREKTVLAGRRAVLEVGLSRAGGRVSWTRDGAELRPGDKYELRRRGAAHSLVIRDVRPSDRGVYRCRAGRDVAQTVLLVEGGS